MLCLYLNLLTAIRWIFGRTLQHMCLFMSICVCVCMPLCIDQEAKLAKLLQHLKFDYYAYIGLSMILIKPIDKLLNIYSVWLVLISIKALTMHWKTAPLLIMCSFKFLAPPLHLIGCVTGRTIMDSRSFVIWFVSLQLCQNMQLRII